MEGIKLWVASLSGVTLIMAVISAVIPKNTAGRVCVLLGEIALIATLISPLKGGLADEIPDMGALYKNEVREKTINATEVCGEMEDKLISKKLSAYVLNKARAKGVLCIELEEKTPVFAEGTVGDRVSAGRVEKLLSEELGISKERQKIKIEGE